MLTCFSTPLGFMSTPLHYTYGATPNLYILHLYCMPAMHLQCTYSAPYLHDSASISLYHVSRVPKATHPNFLFTDLHYSYRTPYLHSTPPRCSASSISLSLKPQFLHTPTFTRMRYDSRTPELYTPLALCRYGPHLTLNIHTSTLHYSSAPPKLYLNVSISLSRDTCNKPPDLDATMLFTSTPQYFHAYVPLDLYLNVVILKTVIQCFLAPYLHTSELLYLHRSSTVPQIHAFMFTPS